MVEAKHVATVAAELKIGARQVEATAALLAEGGTVPFIARYRKERTGELDEVAITSIRDRMTQLAALDDRRNSIVKSMKERDLLTDSLEKSLNEAVTLSALEDIYLPFRPKRKTRATLARERGLEPLSEELLAQDPASVPEEVARTFVDPGNGVEDVEAALQGARDIVAERVNEDADVRREMRELFQQESVMQSKVLSGREKEGAKYRDYFDYREPVAKAPSHRVLAMFRGESEGILLLYLRPDKDRALSMLKSRFVNGSGACAHQVEMAVEDGYGRLLGPAMEVELRMSVRERAGDAAIKVFADNLRELLMAPPLGQKAVLAIDPGFRTGCKTVCLDRQGKLLFKSTLQLTGSERQAEEGLAVVHKMCREFKIEAMAVGNGTGGRETEALLRSKPLPGSIPIIPVNESGASVYSASKAAREEFPNEDITIRGAVSIGRRLMDPLAELVKIEPKSIGVGQYQHDVDQQRLKASLDDVVVSCVNAVGVEVNTASSQLLAYVSGVGPTLAGNIVSYREENGPFESRKDLLKVTRFGPKAFEQAAGFLRIRGGHHALDGTAVHPERYGLVEQMAQQASVTVVDLMQNDSARKAIRLNEFVSDDVGLPTLTDIMAELSKPGRDPRARFEVFSFAEGVNELKDLKEGMKLPGIVTNVTKFGAFVDIGVHQDGLVHISELADRFVDDPAKVVKVQQKVKVTVLEIDHDRKRVSLSMKENPGPRGQQAPREKPSREKKPSGRPPRRGGFSANPFADAFSGL